MKVYRYNVFAIKRILEGKLSQVRSALKKEMHDYSQKLEFENARETRDRLRNLISITQANDISGFLEDANFYFYRQKAALQELLRLFIPYFPNLKKLDRIECFDISNFSADFTVGSQVIFVSGIPEPSLYKRYKIKHTLTPNDVVSMREMIGRRLQHKEWKYPDLLLVDGGKPQVSHISKLLKELGLEFPLAGIAKRLEQLVIPQNGTFALLTLPRNSLALKLVQHMRDEAHRFALTYHRKLRSVALTHLIAI